MSIDTLRKKIVDAAIPADDMAPTVTLRWRSNRWRVEASSLAQDVYGESGDILDRVSCMHVADESNAWAFVRICGTEDESAEDVLTALLDFVTTESPVPA